MSNKIPEKELEEILEPLRGTKEQGVSNAFVDNYIQQAENYARKHNVNPVRAARIILETELLEPARKMAEEGAVGHVRFNLSIAKSYASKVGIPVSAAVYREIELISYRKGVETILADVQKKNIHDLNDMFYINGQLTHACEYAVRAKMNVEMKIRAVEREVYKKGVKLALESAKNKLCAGKNNFDMFGLQTFLKEAREYAAKAEIKVEERVRRIEKKAYRKGLEAALTWAENEINQQMRPSDSQIVEAHLTTAQEYASKVGIDIAKRIQAIRNLSKLSRNHL